MKKIIYCLVPKKLNCNNVDNCRYIETEVEISFRYCPEGGCKNYVPGTSFLNYRLNKYNGDIRFTDFIPSGYWNNMNDLMYSEDGNCKQTSNKPKF